MATYAEKLLDPRWQRKRLEMLERAGWECENCGEKERTLHVHHQWYIYGREPWEYNNQELKVLCDTCHTEAKHSHDELCKLLARVDHLTLDVLRGLLIGWLPEWGRRLENEEMARGYGLSFPRPAESDVVVSAILSQPKRDGVVTEELWETLLGLHKDPLPAKEC